MKTMESICVGQKKFRPTLTNSFYQPPPPHSRMATLRPQSEYGMPGVPWNGYSRGSSGSGSVEWPPWSSPGSRVGAARPRKGRFCSLLLVGGALLALVVVLAVAGLALYMGAFRSDTSDPIIVFEGKLKMRRGVGVGAAAGTPGAARLSAALRQAYDRSVLGPALNSADVNTINSDKLVAFFKLHLDRRKIPNSVVNLEESIRNIIVENSILKNSALRQLNVDPTSILIRRDQESQNSEQHTGLHPETKTSMPVLPQNAKEKILQTRMGVIRKPAVQTNLTSSHKIKTPPPSDEPDVNLDTLPVIQGSFQITKTDADITENKHIREHIKSTSRPTSPKESSTEIEKRKPSRPSMATRKPVTTTGISEPKTQTTINPITQKTTASTSQRTTLTTSIIILNKTENTLKKIETNVNFQKENLPDFLPKLDTLFAVPTYVDQEPWRPIRPGEAFSTDSNFSSVIEEPEDRLGETELVEDISLLEGIANIEEVITPDQFNDTDAKSNKNNLSYQGIWPSYTEYPSEPVYTSFTDPAFSSTHKEIQTLGMNYPKPHPIPVNKLTDEVISTKETGEVSFDGYFVNSQVNASNKADLPYIPPKDKLSTVAINVKPLVNEDKTELVNLNGGVIIRKQNQSNAHKIEAGNDKNVEPNSTATHNFVKIEMLATASKPNSSNNEPMLYSPPSKWEFVNGSSTEQANLKKTTNKTFNETLQAVITENNDPELREIPFKYLPNSQTKNSLLANITNIFEKIVSALNDTNNKAQRIDKTPETFDAADGSPPIYAHGSSEPLDTNTQELLMKELLEQTSSSTLLPTLLPVKSNSGIGRPLRPRPKIPPNVENNGQDRSFSNKNPFQFITEVKTFIKNLNSDDSFHLKNNKSDDIRDVNISVDQVTPDYHTTSVKTDVVTSISFTNKNEPVYRKENETSTDFTKSEGVNESISNNNFKFFPMNITRIREPTRKVDISEKFRLPKTHSETVETKPVTKSNFLGTVPTATEFFLTHPSTQAIALTEKIKMLLRDLGKNQNNLTMTTSSPFFIRADYEDTLPFQNKSLQVDNQIKFNKNASQEQIMAPENKNSTKDVETVNVEITASTSADNVENTTNTMLSNEDLINILKNISVINKTNETKSQQNKDEITAEKLKHLASIAMITDSHNNTFFGNENVAPDETIISTKAVSSSYTVNSAGFKILTKTFNKIPGSFKDDEKKSTKYETSLQALYENQPQTADSDNCGNKSLTVKCSNGLCLPETARCNRLLDCPGGEDELGCTCADYLKSQFLLRKICDGVLDCWDFSDENNCEWCNPEQYVCSNSRQCIDREKICDGERDCPQGDDEKQCVTVALSQEDAKSYPYSKEGYIMVQKHGRWGRLCVQNFDKVVARSHSSLQISDLGRAVCRTMTYNDYENVDRVIEEDSDKDQQYFSLHYTSKGDNSRGGLAFRRSGCSRGQVAKVVCSQLQCGARPQAASQQARIVGGGNAGAGAWPWQAALYKEGDFQCGATLISDRWLISAGHCFYHAQEDFWVARLGALRRGTSFPSPYEQLQPISSVILHPGYIDTGFINDIALLKTANSVAFSDYIRPICLPPYGTDIGDGRRCTVIGWGQLFEVGRIFPDTLQEVELPVISTIECRKRTLFLPLYRITDDMFCAGFDRGGRDACLGDSGGPLMCQEQDNQWYLYGVTSNGYGCARANRPGVYTKVSNYVNWIENTMQVFDDRSFDNLNKYRKNSSQIDLDVSESRSLHRHVDKCRGHRCPLGECLPPTRICNGFMECSDGSDEKDCK